MRLILILVLAAGAAAHAAAQTVTGNLTVRGRLDAAQAASTAPARVVSTLPADCAPGQAVLLMSAPLTEWLHICTAPGVWTRQATVPSWNAITGRPATFPPSAHTHLAGDLPGTLLDSTGSYADPAWLTSLAGAKVTGAVPTATALAANGANCAAGEAAAGVDAQGNAEGCFTPAGGGAGGGGTVTSVGLSAPVQFAVSGSPVTTSGNLAFAWQSQSVNTVLAGPSSGGAASPGFRGLMEADMPGTVLRSTASYADPAWLTSLGAGKLTGPAPDASLGSGTPTPGNFLRGDRTWNPVDWANVANRPVLASANTASAVVQRDASGNFAAGTMTGSLNGQVRNATIAGLNGCNSAGADCLSLRSGLRYSFVGSSSRTLTNTYVEFTPTYTLPANELDVTGAIVRITARGTITITANTNVYLTASIGGLSLGTVDMMNLTTAVSGAHWSFTVDVFITAPTRQLLPGLMLGRGPGSPLNFAWGSASTINVGVSHPVRCGVFSDAASSGTITLQAFAVELLYPGISAN